MNVEIFSKQGAIERHILIAMITSEQALAKLTPKWEKGILSATWSNWVAQQCVRYFQDRGCAPGRTIQSIYDAWVADEDHDPAVAQLIDRFLQSLSDEYESEAESPTNVDFIIDTAIAYFRKLKLRRLGERIVAEIDRGHIDKADALRCDFKPVAASESTGIHLFSDKVAVDSTFDNIDDDVLVKYPGDLGRMFSHFFGRGSFISFLAPEKSGKSFMLQDIALQAMTQRKRVAYFEAGDSSERQLKRRFMIKVARHPIRSSRDDWGWPCQIDFPTALHPPAKGRIAAKVENKVLTFDAPLDQTIAWTACQNLMQSKVKSNKSFFCLSCHPTGTLSPGDIRDILTIWSYEGFIPDVIIVDYADILAPPAKAYKDNSRDQINLIWEELRRIAIERNSLLVTATQANRDSYEGHLLTRKNIAEDKRKLSHVTAAFGINVTAQDREQHSCRINTIAVRDGNFRWQDVVHVAQCLALGNPCVLSARFK